MCVYKEILLSTHSKKSVYSERVYSRNKFDQARRLPRQVATLLGCLLHQPLPCKMNDTVLPSPPQF